MDLKGSLRCNDATATRMSDNDRFHKQDKNLAHVSQFFLYISLPFFHNEEVKMPNDLSLMENVNKQRCFFFCFWNLDMVSWNSSSAVSPLFDKVSK